MRYLISNELFAETLQIGLATGSMPPAFLRPKLEPHTSLSLEPSTILASGPMNLLLAEHTASWALLSDLETMVAQSAQSIQWSALRERYPDLDEAALAEFFARLYQRGLLRVN